MALTSSTSIVSRTFVLLICVKVYALGLLYIQFHRTDLTDSYSAFVFVPEGSTRAERLAEARESFFSRLAPYDGQWYLDVSAKGYRSHGGPPRQEPNVQQGNFAFFPLLPGAIRVLRAVLDDPVPAVIAINLVLSALALTLLWRYSCEAGFSAWIVCGSMLAFPSALFQSVLYTESLFLILSVSFWLLLRSRRLLPAMVVGYLGGLCRPQGILLMCLATELIVLQRKEEPPGRPPRGLTWLVALAPALGLLTVMLLNLEATGSMSSFLDAQVHWGRQVGLDSFADSARELFQAKGALADLGGTVFGLVLLPVLWMRLPAPLALYATASVLMPLATGRILSMGRFLSVSFPHFLALAAVLEHHKRVAWGIIGALALLQLLLSKPLMAWHFIG